MSLPVITGVVLARNESLNIVDCLTMFRPHVGQLILIDMESSDATVELARPLVDVILSHPLIPNFDQARNIAIPVATHEWLWFVDADERISPATGELIQKVVRQHGDVVTAITIPFKSYFCGKWMQHCGWWPGYTMPRVLKRGHFEFSPDLHSGVRHDGLELRIPPDPQLAVDHFSYTSLAHYVEKFNRYTSTEALNRGQPGIVPDWKRGIREMTRDLWGYYEQQRGSQDGYHGWILSWLAGQYRWFTEAKLIDLPHQQAAIASAPVPSSLDEVLELMQAELRQLRGDIPQLPLGVHFRSPLLDPSGYADDGRTILKSLVLLERPVSAQAIPWSDQVISVAPTEMGLFKTLLRAAPGHHYLALTNCIPTLCQPDSQAAYNILRTTFETDRIPAGWLERLEPYDEIWVCAQHNATAFRRSGVAPERIRVLPQAVDTSLFSPQGYCFPRPPSLADRFVFLSIFDWQLRKGWDVLLRSYCQEFSLAEGAGLWLKVSHVHGHTPETIRAQAEELLQTIGESLDTRPDIVIWHECLTAAEMAALYRSANAFVLASRGEGWGRPYLEAMACGLPTIGTTGSGNDDFMNADNSFPVATTAVPVSQQAAEEIPVYQGHEWREPEEASLRLAMRTVKCDAAARARVTQQGINDALHNFSLLPLAAVLENHLQQAEETLIPPPIPPVTAQQIRVELEGELFASHSFSNINEQLADHWRQDPSLALSIRRRIQHPVTERQPGANRLRSYLNRVLPDGPQVVIRHAFPPNWSPPPQGKWIHIQPWEFGYLPEEWVAPLRDQVDEIWAPSNYVREVYRQSGIPGEKIQVIPWGIDPAVYTPSAPDRILPTQKSFKFLFVGGTIPRKGFDLVLAAYLAEFQRSEDVCLVIKDVGTQSFYRYGNCRLDIFAALANPHAPEIIYLDGEMTAGQRASLYTAGHCFVAPYRGEGFGLPILEAMACGLPPIIPGGGPSDDFATPEMAFVLPSQTVPCPHDWKLCGQPTELAIELADLRSAMRQAYTDQAATRLKGERASHQARTNFTWQQSIDRMTARILALATTPSSATPPRITPQVVAASTPQPTKLELSVCLLVRDGEATLADCLARIAPFVQELLVGDLGSTDRSGQIAQEYGATVLDLSPVDSLAAQTQLQAAATQPWVLIWELSNRFTEEDLEQLRLSMYGSEAEPGNSLNGRFNGRLRRNPRWSSLQEIPIGPAPAADLATTPKVPDSRLELVRPSSAFHTQHRQRPSDPQTLLARAQAHFAEGNFFQAECYYTESLAQLPPPSPAHREALAGLIAACQKINDPYRADEFTQRYIQTYQSPPSATILPFSSHAKPTLKLYLGAGQKRLSGYLHVDVVPGAGIDLVHDLDQRPWPWLADSVGQIVAEDLVEHLSINLIEFCNEAWRVLQPGGELYIRTPHYQGESSWIDPTHRWHLHDQSFQYVDPETFWGRTYPHYTQRKWEILSLGVRGPQNIHALLRPRKDAP